MSRIVVAVVAGLVVAALAVALRRGERRWPVWVGLVAGAMVVGSWAAMIVYIVLNPY